MRLRNLFGRNKNRSRFSIWIALVLITGFLPFYSAFGFVSGSDRYELSIGADVPFYAPGMHLRYNWNTQYYTKLGAGFALDFLMKINQKLLNELGVSPNTRVLTSALVNSLVFDFRMGWSMSMYEGPYIELGYGLMLWGKGEVDGIEINEAVNPAEPLSNDTYQVNIMNHGPSLHIGYRFILIDKLTFNMDVGAYKPLFSKTELNYGGNQTVPVGDSGKINDLVIRDLWFLSVGIWLGLSF